MFSLNLERVYSQQRKSKYRIRGRKFGIKAKEKAVNERPSSDLCCIYELDDEYLNSQQLEQVVDLASDNNDQSG